MAENTSDHDDRFADRANDLYWNSDRTVDEIVDELGTSRGTLYASVRPVPAGATCSRCGDRLVFTNRTSRSSGAATCPSCQAEVDLSEPAGVGAAGEDRSTGRDVGYDGVGEGSAWSRWRHDLAGVAPERAALIGGAAALGVVVGAVAARAVRG